MRSIDDAPLSQIYREVKRLKEGECIDVTIGGTRYRICRLRSNAYEIITPQGKIEATLHIKGIREFSI